MLIVIRHGERADLVENTIQQLHEYDPELTEEGIKQAYSIGEQLKQILAGKSILVVTSPFTRTIMTSLNVIKGLNEDKTDIIVDTNYSEYISKNTYKECPRKYLSLYNNNFSSFEELKDRFDIFRTYDSFPSYPETINECLTRYINGAEKTLNEYSQNYDVIIIVTHGYGVSAICQNYGYDLWEIDYCYSFIFDINNTIVNLRKMLKP